MRRAVLLAVDFSLTRPVLGGPPPNKPLSRPSNTDQGTSRCLWVMVTITVGPCLRYSPSNILCEKRPEFSSPRSTTPFALAALLALSSSEEGLAAVSMRKVLAMPLTSCRCARSLCAKPKTSACWPFPS